jgi:hypothetical protein
MMSRFHWKKIVRLRRLFLHILKNLALIRRKHVEELLSSSTSTSKAAVGEPSAPNLSDIEIFDALDS